MIPFQNDGNVVFTIYVCDLNGASHSSYFFSGSLSLNTLLQIADLLSPRPILVSPRIAGRRQGWYKFVIKYSFIDVAGRALLAKLWCVRVVQMLEQQQGSLLCAATLVKL
jgi:hypothetical protein